MKLNFDGFEPRSADGTVIMETSEVMVKMEPESDVKTEPFEPNTESPAIFDGNIKFELKTEPEIVDFDSSILTQDHQYEDTDFDASSSYIGFDSKLNITDDSVISDAIIKEEPEFYDSCVGEFVPTSQLTELLDSNTATKSNLAQKCAKNPSKPFKCEQCSATFNQNFMLTQHIKIHKQMAKTKASVSNRPLLNRQRFGGLKLKSAPKAGQPFECSVCRKRFNTKVALDSHETIHTGEKSYQCDVCKRQFRLKHHLDSHSKSHAKQVEYSNLNSGEQESKPLSKVNSNILDEPTVGDVIVKEEPEFYDPNISQVIPSSQLTDLLEPNTTVKRSIISSSIPKSAKNPSKKFKCHQCSATFDQHSMLKQHMKIHKQMVAEAFVCSYCCRQFSNRQRLSCHERIHRGEQPFECSTCHKRFNTKVSLDTHQSIHTGEKSYQCDVCNRHFRLKQHLDRHMCKHRSKDSASNRAVVLSIPEELNRWKLYECYLCAEKFQFNAASLRLHFQSKHIGAALYECDFCSRKFLQKYSILNHLQRIHMRRNDPKHKCSKCDWQFQRKEDLNYHLKNHTMPGERFQCEFCPMQLSTKTTLRIHRKTHTGLRPYECEYCEKKFLKSGCLRRHIMTHTGERPFGCNICFQKFSRNHLLTDHKRNVHKIFRK